MRKVKAREWKRGKREEMTNAEAKRSRETKACEMSGAEGELKCEKAQWPNEPNSSQVKEYVDEREGVAPYGVRVGRYGNWVVGDGPV